MIIKTDFGLEFLIAVSYEEDIDIDNQQLYQLGITLRAKVENNHELAITEIQRLWQYIPRYIHQRHYLFFNRQSNECQGKCNLNICENHKFETMKSN